MGRKKKRAAPNPLERIFCYYCDRTFQNEHELLMHQREKHLRCPTCNKRMISIGSLTVHSTQMHNTVITAVPNAIPSRSSPEVAVLGMQGIPEDYYARLAAQNGNPSKLQRKQHHNGNALHQQQQSIPTYHQQARQLYPYQQPANSASAPYQQSPYPPYSYPPYTHQPPQAQQPYSYGSHPYYNTSGYQHQHSQPYQYPSYPSRRDYGPYDRRQNQQYHQYRHHPSSTALSAPTSAPTTANPSAQEKPSSVSPTIQPSKSKVVQNVKVIFDKTDVSMEELRAQLPRYRIK